MVKIEISSEKLAQKFLGAGLQKSRAVGLAGVREGLAVLGSNFFVQGYDLTPGDFALAAIGGYRGSIFFSKQRLPDLKPKDLVSVQKKLTSKALKLLTKKQKEKFAKKLIKKQSAELTKNQLDSLVKKLSKEAIAYTDKFSWENVAKEEAKAYSKVLEYWAKYKDK